MTRNFLFLLLTLSAVSAQASVGEFMFVSGTVTVKSSTGQSRQAKKGQEVDLGDTVSTSTASTAQIRMSDGGFLAVRPQSEIRVDSYSFHDKRSDNSTISLVKGSFRAITGLIGKNNPRNDLVRTPTATIGIRGTDHEVAYIPPKGE